MCTRERALELGQKLEIVEDAERRIAEYEKKHGKPMSKTGQAMWMLRGLVEVYDKTLLLCFLSPKRNNRAYSSCVKRPQV